MITLPHKMIVRIKHSVLEKITNASTGNAAEQAGVLWRNVKEVSHCKWGKDGKAIHQRPSPGWIGTIVAKEMQKAIDKGTPSFQYQRAVIRAPLSVDPRP